MLQCGFELLAQDKNGVKHKYTTLATAGILAEMVEEDGKETQKEQSSQVLTQKEQTMEKKRGKSRFMCQGVFSCTKKWGGGREGESCDLL